MEKLRSKQKTAPDQVTREQASLMERLRQRDSALSRIQLQKQELEQRLNSLKSNSRSIQRLMSEIQEMKKQCDVLKRSKEQSERELRGRIEEKTKEIQAMSRQLRQQLRQISGLQHDNQKVGLKLSRELEKTTTLARKLKEAEKNAEITRREHERYSKEDQKRVQWLEKQLALQGRKDNIIRQLQNQVKQKSQRVEHLRKMLKVREAMTMRREATTRRKAPRVATTDGESPEMETEDLEEDIAHTVDLLDVDSYKEEELERMLTRNNYDEGKALQYLLSLNESEAKKMLCVLFRKMVDFRNEFSELQSQVGEEAA